MRDKLLGVTGRTAQLVCVWLFSGAGGLRAHCAAHSVTFPLGTERRCTRWGHPASWGTAVLYTHDCFSEALEKAVSFIALTEGYFSPFLVIYSCLCSQRCGAPAIHSCTASVICSKESVWFSRSAFPEVLLSTIQTVITRMAVDFTVLLLLLTQIFLLHSVLQYAEK